MLYIIARFPRGHTPALKGGETCIGEYNTPLWQLTFLLYTIPLGLICSLSNIPFEYVACLIIHILKKIRFIYTVHEKLS